VRLVTALFAFCLLLNSSVSAQTETSASRANATEKIIIDTDIGSDIDDAFAVGLALHSPEFQLFGHYVSASAAMGLLAAADGNHLRLYNLKSGRNIDEYLFPDAPVYTRFSTAGNRLLVLTAQQFAYVIDVEALTSSDGDRPDC